MRYIPATDSDRSEMLATIKAESVETLLKQIPDNVRLRRRLSLPNALSEQEVLEHMQRLSVLNASTESYSSFLGGGAYDHIIPSVVNHLASRPEFYTPYTPYQPELSQGTLQAIYEYQTLICQLTGMEAANASMYDGASATAEAALMAARINGRKKVLTARAVHPEYREVLRTYTAQSELTVHEVGVNQNGATDADALIGGLSEETSSVIIQNPNFFGVVEDISRLTEAAHDAGAFIIVTIPEPISLGIIRPPGEAGADIVVGEGQALGNDINYGGPYLGFFTTRGSHLRNIPGRLVGRTVDSSGRTGYVLTLATREQHIRRFRATSNICTNEALCALRASIFMSTLGRGGFKDLALLNLRKAAYAKDLLSRIEGCALPFAGSTFNEFVLQLPLNVEEVNRKLLEDNIMGGMDLSKDYPELGNAMLVCVTEKKSREDIDRLAQALENLL